jgi:chitodextrinase
MRAPVNWHLGPQAHVAGKKDTTMSLECFMSTGGTGHGALRGVAKRLLLWTLLVLPVSAFAQSGPIGYWKLDEGTGTTTADASGSGNTGTLVNSPGWVTGRINSALSFDTNRYVTAGAASGLANLYSTGMTVTAWIKPASAGTGSGGRIVDKSNGGAGWSLKMNGTTKVQFAASEFATTDATRDSGASITLSTWQHVAVTWTGSATATNIHLYINGTLSDATATNGAGASRDDSASPLAIGNRPVDAARAFDGPIDDVRVYNRILTLTEIQALADSTVPSTPTGLTATPASSTQINLSWTASTDNVAVTGYRVERCQGASCTTFAEIGSPTGTTYNSTGLTASTTYRYRIRATDANTNFSAYSSIVNATTSAAGGDTVAPTAPTGLSATAVSSTQINLSWTASTDNVAVTGYSVERCQGAGCTTFSSIATPTGTTFNDTGRTASTTYRYQVRARDAVPNWSLYSSIATATTPAVSDTQAPTAPTGLTIIAGANQIVLSWTASTDNVGVVEYRVERCQGASCSSFADIGGIANSPFTDSTAIAGLSYSYRVRARDAVPNYSGYSGTGTAIPADCD